MIPIKRSRARESCRLLVRHYCNSLPKGSSSMRRATAPPRAPLVHFPASSASAIPMSTVTASTTKRALALVDCSSTAGRTSRTSSMRVRRPMMTNLYLLQQQRGLGLSTAATATTTSAASARSKSTSLAARHSHAASANAPRRRIQIQPQKHLNQQQKQQQKLTQTQQQKQQQQQLSNSNRSLHSSSRKQQSTTTLDFTYSSPSPLEVNAAGSFLIRQTVPPPTIQSLRTLFVASAIPMVGFGFMDNLVMIQAGQYIDSTIGVKLGLATMTAAAAGQVISDVSGVVFGGTLERFLTQLALIESPSLTTAQRQLSVCRNVSMAGAVCGVVVGCTLGAMTLLFCDLEKRHRIERAQQLREIVTDMIFLSTNDNTKMEEQQEEEGLLPVGTCCVYVANAEYYDVDHDDDRDVESSSPSSDDTKNKTPQKTQWRTTLKLLDMTSRTDMGHDDDGDSSSSFSLVQECAKKQQILVSRDRTILYLPIMEDDDVLAVMELRHQSRNNKNGSSSNNNLQAGGGTTTGFSETNVRTAGVVARHLAIFMNRLVE